LVLHVYGCNTRRARLLRALGPFFWSKTNLARRQHISKLSRKQKTPRVDRFVNGLNLVQPVRPSRSQLQQPPMGIRPHDS
jgi:hypothetical protein